MRRKSNGKNRRVVALDFFCGCGGVTHGLRKAGIEVLAGFDNDPDVKYAYTKNNNRSKFFEIDLTDTELVVKKIKLILKDNRFDDLIFSACAPCQPFSVHMRHGHTEDERRTLMNCFIDIVKKLPKRFQPKIIFCENVGTMKSRGRDVLEKSRRTLERFGYEFLDQKIINAADFGVPQNRKRLMFIAAKKSIVKNNKKFSWEYFYGNYRTKDVLTVRDKIGNGRLRPIKAGNLINKDDPLHISPLLTDINLKRISAITKPGGTRAMWPSDLNLKCYKNHKGHKDVYGRMSWGAPAPTLTCRCTSISNGRFGHPTQNRAISLREAAILQTMDKYKFQLPIKLGKVAEQIGNSVPPELSRRLGKFILQILKEAEKSS